MNLSRRTVRNIIRNQFGNRKLADRFKAIQIKRYGYKYLMWLHYYNSKKKPHVKTLKQRKVKFY